MTAFWIALLLVSAAVWVRSLVATVRGDGYGHRPPPPTQPHTPSDLPFQPYRNSSI